MARFVRKSIAKMNVQDIDLYINELNVADLAAKKAYLEYKEANKDKSEVLLRKSNQYTHWYMIASELRRVMNRREYLTSETANVTMVVRKYCKPLKASANGYLIATISGVKVSIDLIGDEEVDAVSDIQKDLIAAGFKVSDVKVYDDLFTKHVRFFTEVQK